MNYTVSDFYETFRDGLKLIAGDGGMSRPVRMAGILDYELDPVLRDKYSHTNFQQGQIVISTFLCAKDNPHMIVDAVKHLISKGTSALVIKNVFDLPVHDAALRYADNKNYPVFIVTKQTVYVEELIYEVSRHVEIMSDNREMLNRLERVLSGDLTEEEMLTEIKAISPSFKDRFFTVYIKFDDMLTNADVDEYGRAFASSELNVPGNVLIVGEEAMFIIISSDNISYRDENITRVLEGIVGGTGDVSCGVSAYHSTRKEFKMSLLEAVYAAGNADKHFTKYTELGTYQCIFPFAKTSEMRIFAERVLSSVESYDIENNASLMMTLSEYIKSECSVERAAQALGQHKNTVRYRLDKIRDLTGLDYKIFSHLEQLSFALKINTCA